MTNTTNMTNSSPITAPKFLTTHFVLTAITLLIMAIGFRPTLRAVISYFGKDPIELRRTLHSFDTDGLPSFRFVEDRAGFGPISKDDELGTSEYFEHVFQQRGTEAFGRPLDNLLLFVTYYSDAGDQIPHTPEVCYRQAGGVVEEMRTVPLEVPGLEPKEWRVDDGWTEARSLTIEIHGHKRLVTYVICHNGQIFYDRERTRLAMGLPGDKRTYFSKIEVVAFFETEEEKEATQERSNKLLAEALAALVRGHYPKLEELSRK